MGLLEFLGICDGAQGFLKRNFRSGWASHARLSLRSKAAPQVDTLQLFFRNGDADGMVPELLKKRPRSRTFPFAGIGVSLAAAVLLEGFTMMGHHPCPCFGNVSDGWPRLVRHRVAVVGCRAR
jgi:hypothetical protein